jgi:hypothetical protein
LPAGTAGSIRFRNRWIPGGDGAPALANHLPVEHRK